MEFPVSFDEYPVLTLEELKERVRDGEEDLMVGALNQMRVSTEHPNVLYWMREISATDFFVYKGQKIIARLERPSASPLPDPCDEILRHCQEHTFAIRNRSDALLKRLHSSTPALDHYVRIMKDPPYALLIGTLVEIERRTRGIRNAFEALFYNEYTHDAFREEEYYAQLADGIEQGYANLQQMVTSMEQSLS